MKNTVTQIIDPDFTKSEVKILTEKPQGKVFKRYLTCRVICNNHVSVYEEKENPKLSEIEWDEFVWQFASSKEQAVIQHDAKYQLYREMSEFGFPELHTY